MNTLAISDLIFPAFAKNQLKKIPLSYGLEYFIEFGSNAYWEQLFPLLNSDQRAISLHGPCVTVNLADPLDTQYMNQFKEAFTIGKNIHADFVVVHTNEFWLGHRTECQELVIKRLQELAAFTHSINGPLMAVENVGLHENNLFNESEYISLFETIPHIVSIIDVGHANVNNWDLHHVIKTLNSKIVAFHLHDNDGQRDQHQPINTGTINWPELFQTIHTYAPNATKVLEYANGSFANSNDLLQHIMTLQDMLTIK
ncbi:sugar phosphate isomerase/epimerase family protein [Veillonella criceti]|uniref:Fructoselysine 3-epimerase n=1 Tax=Veillonella criceti TaxID=103891 RepID=A0A380NLC7_9FIRM|nr:TIM barrel protein [Veillonella criceti]SUP43894.1 fructoselysine 3-epimerase [Veillonella criceti]